MLTLTTSYDKQFDVLYMRPADYIPSYADEDDNGVVTLRSIDDDIAVGMVIYNFKSRIMDGTLLKCKLPFCVDLNDKGIKNILVGA